MNPLIELVRRSSQALALLAALSLLTPVAAAADELVLYRRSSDDGAVTFFVRGARAGETVVLVETVDGISRPLVADVADANGGTFFFFGFDDAAWLQQPQSVALRAVVERSGTGGPEVVDSNPVLLRDPPLLWLVVERDDSSSRVLRFDAEQETLDEARRSRQRRDGRLTPRGDGAILQEDAALVALGSGGSTRFQRGEEPLDLALTPDESALLALTRETTGDGATLLRVRMLDAGQLATQIASFELLRSSSRVVSAWLVAGDDSHRVLIAEREGSVHELVLGTALTRGITLLPLADGGREEIVDCVVAGDWLAVTTRDLASGRGGGRLFVVDLARRDRLVAHALAGRPLELVAMTGDGGPAACVALDNDSVVRIAFADGARSQLDLPGVSDLVAGGAGRQLYAAARSVGGDGTAIFAIDPALASARLLAPLGELGRSLQELGVVASGEREWLFVIERRFAASKPGSASVDDHLGWVEVDPRDGSPKGDARFLALGGRLRGLAAR